MTSVTKVQFMSHMKKAYTAKHVIDISDKKVRIEVPDRDRETVAKHIAKAHGGRVSSSKKTEIEFTGFTAIIKNPIAGSNKTKTNNVEFGLLREFQKLKIVTQPYTLNAPSPKEPDEAKFINKINKHIKEIGSPIDIKIDNKIYKSICGANKVHGTPKADIVLVQLVDGSFFREVTFISHKKEGGASAFQQYGGLSDDAGIIISEDPLVLKFLSELAAFVKLKTGKYEAVSGVSVYQYVPNTAAGRSLVARSLFGPNWQPNKYGYDSVHCVAQGVPNLIKSGKTYELTAEAIHPPTPNWALKGNADDFRAVFAGTFRNDRKFIAKIRGKEQVVHNMRVGIYPYAFVKGRKATEI